MTGKPDPISLSGYLLQIVVGHSFRGVSRVRPGLRETFYALFAVAVVGYVIAFVVAAAATGCTRYDLSAHC